MWKVVGTAVQGRGHLKNNTPVQDKIFHLKDSVNVIALADGAGSAYLSHFGAQCAVETICHLLNEHFDKIYGMTDIAEAQKFIIDEILIKLTALAEQHVENLKEFASTLLCVAVKDKNILIFHLGDGEIGAIKNDELVSISSSENGEYANTTFFITSSHVAKHLKIFKSSNAKLFSSFFLLSDGAATSFYSKRQNKFSPILSKIIIQSKYTSESAMNEMLEESFEMFVKQKTMDDCSLIAMTYANEQNSYKSLTKEEKDYLFSTLQHPKHCSVKKFDKIVQELAKPLTLQQLAKKVHFKKKYVIHSIRALNALGIITFESGKYRLVEAE